VLEAMGGQIEFSGLPWKNPGEVATYGINSLVSNILCVRHNTALSSLDEATGRIFRVIQEICLDLKKNSLSRKRKWFLVSGEALELWGLKTLFGLFHAKLATNQGQRVVETHTLDVNRFITALGRPGLAAPCGLYLHAAQGGSILNVEEKVTATPLRNEEKMLLIGIRIGLHSFEFDIVMDPHGVNFPLLTQQMIFHPWQLLFKNRLREHMLMITWPDSISSFTVVEFKTYL
jgi:hypothetical protein